jgi:hypothetical protein
MKHTVALGLFSAALLAFAAGPVNADKTDDAVAQFKRGVGLFKSGSHGEAVEAFRRANELKPSWKLQYNIGQCEAALKRYGLAIEAFECYLAEGGDEVPAERRDEVLSELDRLRKMVGFIRIIGGSGIVVYVDRVERGTTPMKSSIQVTAGVEHWIWLVKDGRKLLTVNEKLSGGETVELNAPSYVPPTTPPPSAAPAPPPALTTPSPSAVAPAPPPASMEPAAASAAVASEPDEAVESTDPEPEEADTADTLGTMVDEPTPSGAAEGNEDHSGTTDQGSGKIGPGLFWIGLGGTVVFGGLTAVMAGVVNSKWEDTDDPWEFDQAAADDIRTLQIVGYVGLGLTGLALITTVIAIPLTDFKGGGDGKDSARIQIAPVALTGGGGLSLGGRF